MTYEVRAVEDGLEVWIDGKQVIHALRPRKIDLSVPVEHFGEFHERGFQLPLENGLMVSTVWGTGTYSTNYCFDAFTEQATTAEMAAWWTERPGDDGDMMVWLDEDNVLDYVPADKWWDLIAALSKLPTRSQINESPDVAAILWGMR